MPYVTGTFTVVMESGDVLRLASDGSWKHSQAELLAAGAQVSAPYRKSCVRFRLEDTSL